VDFDFTTEQTMLRDLTRELLGKQSPSREVRRLMADPVGFNLGLWQQMADMGLLGLAVPDRFSGQGLGMLEQALVLEEMGRTAYPGPYFASAVLATTALLASEDATAQATYLPGLASGTGIGTLAYLEDGVPQAPLGVRLSARANGDAWLLSGVKRFVPFAHTADVLLVVARTGTAPEALSVFALDPNTPGVRLAANVGFDLTSRTSSVAFDNVRLPYSALVGALDGGWEPLRQVLRRAAVAASAEMLGCARRCLEMAVEYAKVREQFGQPIGSFQAVRHTLADMLLEVETAFGATYAAAWALDAAERGDAVDADTASSVAKAYVSEAARKVCGNAIQVHGGIGFTWDHDVHLYFNRAKHQEMLYGNVEFHREQVLQTALAQAERSHSVPVTA
jgi:alkylation response protein AidB-like acyl-CoA dehydrogenase